MNVAQYSNAGQLAHHAGLRHLGLVTEAERASLIPARIRRPAPRLGEHTLELLHETGFAAPQIERLTAAGAVALLEPV